MAYYVAKYPKYPNRWRLVWRKYELDKNSKEYKAKVRHVPDTEYARLGLKREMCLDEAKAIVKKINLTEAQEKRETDRNAAMVRVVEDGKILCMHLPTPFVEKFETVHLATRYLGNDARLSKVMKLWRTSQKVVRTIKIPMEQWYRYPEHFYAYFERHAVSPGYVKNLLSTMNMWIDFLGAEQGKNYRLIPMPTGSWGARIQTAFKEAGKQKDSAPITPAELAAAEFPNDAQWNWVYCTVWAGLRPSEASALTNKKRTRIETKDGISILWVYQSKLKHSVEDVDARWKGIPLFLPEQQKIVEIVKNGEIEEPLCKTVQSRFGERHTLYAGRKGFHELMVTVHEQDELEVIRWLGHRSLDMARKHYENKKTVRWSPVAAKRKSAA